MMKRIEKADGRSCWNKADPHEIVFVLLGRDPAAKAAISAWIEERIKLGKNQTDDHQLKEAAATGEAMATQAKTWHT